jgi:chromosome segregation ATPase
MATKLSVDAVYDAFKVLLERGEYPSRTKLRAAIGTTASEQTLQKRIAEVYARVAAEMGGELPAGLPRYAVEAAQRLYDEIRGDAQKEIDQAKAQHQTRESELSSRLDQANAERSALHEQLAYLQERLEQASGQINTLTSDLQTSRETRDALSDERDRLATANTQSRREAARAVRSSRSAHRKALASAADREQALARQLETAQVRAESERDRLMQELDRARQETEREKAARQDETKQQQTALARRDDQIVALSQQNYELRSECTEAKRQAQVQQEQTRTATAARIESEKECGGLRERCDELAEQNQALESQRRNLARDLEVAEARAQERGETIAMLRRRA